MESRSTIINRLDIRQIAVGILHLNLGKAILDFPGSTKAHPSRWVVISLTTGGSLDGRFRQYFPFKVIWHLWEDVVVPVLQDPTYQVITRTEDLRNQINQQSLWDGDYNTLLARIEEGIVTQMQVVGLLPAEGVTPTEEETVIEESGSSDETFPIPDSDLIWIEGHPRLIYPVVD